MLEHVYTGPTEAIYPAHLAVAPDGTYSTLVGVPGGPPVTVLGEPPGDGRWVPVVDERKAKPDTAPPADKPSKTSKAVAS